MPEIATETEFGLLQQDIINEALADAYKLFYKLYKLKELRLIDRRNGCLPALRFSNTRTRDQFVQHPNP